MTALRWGIAGAGGISRSFVVALRTLPKSEHQLVAVGARDVGRARQFCDDNMIATAKAHGSYAELARDDCIDVVYVGVVTGMHHDVVNLLLKAGKHVVCEKPLGVNAQQVSSMIECARKYKRFLMEGVWSLFFPAMVRLREELERETVGEPTIVTGHFGMKLDSSVNMYGPDGGSLIHLGMYLVAFARYIFREKSHSVAAVAEPYPSGVDACTAFSIKYPRGKMATFICSSQITCDDNGVTVYGTKGKLEIPNSIQSPTRLNTPERKHDFTSDLPHADVQTNHKNATGFTYQIKHVKECLEKGLLESPIISHEDSLEIVKTLDEIRKQANITYDCD
ncbi:trans-1,2-dihydrobenzene-1,2-diol dehydrogenase-like [Tubulanus polymorphus]|uniref:trans-1,2-dihydrobenzene-1,2-diol dehydrogenase-like n=1 Tax=Tubulanus polymorphus TaxID=672921 RepID=UPI003DA4B4DD